MSNATSNNTDTSPIVAPPAALDKKTGSDDDVALAASLGPAEITAEDIGLNEGGGPTNNAAAVEEAGAVKDDDGAVKADDDDGGGKLGTVDDAAAAVDNETDIGTAPAVAAPVISPAVAAAAAAAPDPSANARWWVPTTTKANPFTEFGISNSALLAPVPPPAKKKRKTQDEFTISQKLEILSELKGPHPPSIPSLAAKHNTSRTSIYRWKKDMPRLVKLAKRDGKGQSKRVSNKRKLYNEEFTVAEKLAVVRELRGENAPSVRSLAERCGANHRSIYRWKKDEARLAKIVEQDGLGECKRVGGDALLRVKEALRVFHASHYVNAATGDQQPLTGTVVATKARQIRDEMLAQHAVTPFLTEEEVRGMKEFTASTSWGRKIVQKFGWKVGYGSVESKRTTTAATSTTAAAATTTAAAEADYTIDLEALASKNESLLSKKPSKAAAASDARASKRAHKIVDMKREIILLRRKLGSAEAQARHLELAVARALYLEEENAQLRAQLGTFVNNGSVDEITGDGSASVAAGSAMNDLGAKDDANETAVGSSIQETANDVGVDAISPVEEEEDGADVGGIQIEL